MTKLRGLNIHMKSYAQSNNQFSNLEAAQISYDVFFVILIPLPPLWRFAHAYGIWHTRYPPIFRIKECVYLWSKFNKLTNLARSVASLLLKEYDHFGENKVDFGVFSLSLISITFFSAPSLPLWPYSDVLRQFFPSSRWGVFWYLNVPLSLLHTSCKNILLFDDKNWFRGVMKVAQILLHFYLSVICYVFMQMIDRI